jgi:hypothetical protein
MATRTNAFPKVVDHDRHGTMRVPGPFYQVIESWE